MTERQQFRDKSFAQNELFNRKVEFFLWALLHLIFAFFYHKISSMNSKVRVKNTKLEINSNETCNPDYKSPFVMEWLEP